MKPNHEHIVQDTMSVAAFGRKPHIQFSTLCRRLEKTGIIDMSRALKIKLTVPNPLSVQGLVHDFKNFGEDVYRILRDECVISLQEIDTSVDEFHLRGLHKREVREITAKVSKILEKYNKLSMVEICEISDDHEA